MTSYYRFQQCCVKFGAKVRLSNCNVGSFAKLQKAVSSFFMSVPPYGKTQLPLVRCSWDLIFEYFLKIPEKFWVVVPCIWFQIRINYQLDAIEYLFPLARHVSGLYAHLQEQWML